MDIVPEAWQGSSGSKGYHAQVKVARIAKHSAQITKNDDLLEQSVGQLGARELEMLLTKLGLTVHSIRNGAHASSKSHLLPAQANTEREHAYPYPLSEGSSDPKLA